MAVEGGIPPDLLHFAEGLAGEQVLVERGDLPDRAAARTHRHVARTVRAALVERERAVGGDGERAAAVGTRVHRAQVTGELLNLAVEGYETDLGVAFVVVLDVDAAAVRSPDRARHAAVQPGTESAQAAPVHVHQPQPAELVGADPILVPHERDLLSVGGHRRAAVRPVPVGQRPDLAAGDRGDVELGVAVVPLPVRIPVRGEDQVRSVRRPGGRTLVLEVARGHLDRGSAVDGQHEEVVEAEVEIAHPVLPVLEPVLHDGRVGPLGARGRFRRRHELRRRIGNQHVEGERPAVGRPADSAGRLQELRESGRLARVHPAQVDLSARGVGEAGAVR